MTSYTSLELCAGAGGQARGLEQAGFDHCGLVEIDQHAVATLRENRPSWNVLAEDLFTWQPPAEFRGVDLLAGGVPCPPFSHAGLQLGEADERNLFDRALEIIEDLQPRAVMIENVRGLMDPKFATYRQRIIERLERAGYVAEWRLFQASDFGVAQLRPRSVLVGLRPADGMAFRWPEAQEDAVLTVGEAIADLMGVAGWTGVDEWSRKANRIAPTLVGGSKKHGGADLGPTRARRAWAALGVEGKSLADAAPGPDFEGMPRLTVRMAARLQGFEDSWSFSGGKTAQYRQVGNAFPPPVARALGDAIRAAFHATDEGIAPAHVLEFGAPAQAALELPATA